MHSFSPLLPRSLQSGLAVLALSVLLLPLACSPDQNVGSDAEASPNTLTQAERDAGWSLLFDGEGFDGWTGLGRDTIPQKHWVIEDGVIRKVESDDVPTAPDGQPLEGGDIMTEDTYRNFELTLEWKASKSGNSGIKGLSPRERSHLHVGAPAVPFSRSISA